MQCLGDGYVDVALVGEVQLYVNAAVLVVLNPPQGRSENSFVLLTLGEIHGHSVPVHRRGDSTDFQARQGRQGR
jgi:hypothetical protein